jgi:hypothetical protein
MRGSERIGDDRSVDEEHGVALASRLVLDGPSADQLAHCRKV